MSFMAGFGQGFSRSFDAGIDRIKQEESDIFKTTFNTYLEGEKERKSKAAVDEANARKAAGLADSVAAGVNKKAATAMAYQWLSQDVPESEILNRLKTGQFSMEEKQSLEAQTEAVTGPGSSKTKQENLEKIQLGQEAVSKEPSKPKSWRDNFAGGLFNSPYSKQERQLTKAQQKIADRTGKSLEEIQSSMTGPGYQSGKLIDATGVKFTPAATTDKVPKTAKEALLAAQTAYAKGDTEQGDYYQRIYDTYLQAVSDEERAKIEGASGISSGSPIKIFNPQTRTWEIASAIEGMPDQDGNRVFLNAKTNQPLDPNLTRPIGTEEAKASEAIRKGLEKETIAHASAQAHYGNVLHLTDQAIRIGQETPEALTHYTSRGSQIFANVKQEAMNAYNMGLEILNPALKKGMESRRFDPNQLQAAGAKIQQGISGIDQQEASGKIDKVAAAAARLKMYNTLMAFEVAMAYGQEGRSLSDRDIALFMEITSESVNPQRQLESLAELMNQLEVNLDNEAKAKFGNNSISVERFFEKYRYNPLGNVSKSVKDVVVADNPKLQKAYDFYKQNLAQRGVIDRGMETPTQVQNSPPPGQMVAPQPSAPPPAAVQKLKQILSNLPQGADPEQIKQSFMRNFNVTEDQFNQIMSQE